MDGLVVDSPCVVNGVQPCSITYQPDFFPVSLSAIILNLSFLKAVTALLGRHFNSLTIFLQNLSYHRMDRY